MSEPERQAKGLPDNAFRELKEGETYKPIVGDEVKLKEVTVRSVVAGLVMAVLFSGAATYITLKLGQGIETAIPIAILAVGLSAVLKRHLTILENVNILAVGATSGIVAGGSVFVMPAIFILNLDDLSSLFQIFLVPLLGAVLGLLFLIPFRRYFVREMHGKLPFPEGTATTEILVAGEKGGRQARVLLRAMIIGGIYDFCVQAFEVFRENFTTAIISVLGPLTHKVKAVFSLNTSAAIAGLGYLIGVRYAAMITAGSFLSYFVVVPLINYLGGYIHTPIPPSAVPISEMSGVDIFEAYATKMGVGGIFAAGVISVFKLSPVIGQAFRTGAREILARRSSKGDAAAPTEARGRTDQDIPMTTVGLILVGLIILIWIYFRFSVLASQPSPTLLATVAVAVTVLIAFLFTSVSAWAVAMISVTPISGMTLMTLIVSSVIMVQLGLSGREGMLAMLLIGGVVCTALSMSATLVTEFKISYWVGATPRKVQWSNIAGCVVAAVAVTLVMYVLYQTFGFHRTEAHPNPLPAPQPRAMAAVLTGMMGTGEAPWLLYGIGAVVAIIVEMLGVSGLAFALGMYIPIEYNAPILVGAIVAYLVKRSSEDEKISHRRHERGLLVSSGLIAGGAILSVVVAVIKFTEVQAGIKILRSLGNVGPLGNWMGLVGFVCLLTYLYLDSVRGESNGNGTTAGTENGSRKDED